jgi:RecA/RadA recombinase
LLEKRKKVDFISTGSLVFDKILGGGMETGLVLECYGEAAVGKTQIAHMLAAQCIKKFPNSYVVMIDCENTCRPERIEAFAVGLGLDPVVTK